MEEIPENLNRVIIHAEQSEFMASLEIDYTGVSACCKVTLQQFEDESVLQGLKYSQGSMEWMETRRSRITGTHKN